MSEYIEREAALESVREKLMICDSLPDTIAKDASLFTLASMQDSLKSIPAADVRPVVLCRDCKWTKTDETDDPAIYCMQWDRWETPPDGFCWLGEKREER